jgi:hypothetical protein
MWPIVPFLAVPPAQPLPMPPPPVVAVYDAVYDEPPPRWESIRPRPRATAVGVGAGVATALVSGVLTWSLTQKVGATDRRFVEPLGRI